MPLFSSVIPLPTRGAGRVSDMTWPNWNSVKSGAITGNNTARNSGANGVPIGVSDHLDVGNGGTTWAFWRGRNCVQYFANTAAQGNGAVDYLDAMAFNNATQKGEGELASADDFAVTRMICILAYAPAPVTLFPGDSGMELVNGNTMIANGEDGMGFKITADHEVSFIARNAAGFTSDPVSDAIPGFNHELWHAYELRVINAGPTQEGAVKVFIDGINVANYSYGVGTILPLPHAGVFYNFRPIMAVTSGKGLFVSRIRQCIGPTEASTL